MPKKSNYPGVERRGDRLRIRFQWQGKTAVEYHHAPPTAAGLTAAARDRARIVQEIKLGVFDYATWFPDSKHAERQSGPTFFEQSQTWITRARSELAASTLNGYLKKINPHWIPALHHRPVAEITAGELKDIAAALDIKSGKTYNDSLTPLKAIFQSAIDDGLRTDNPAQALKNRKHQKPEVDPLTLGEMHTILEWIEQKRPEWWPYFALSFGCGARPSELIALRWRDIDTASGYIQISRAYVLQEIKSTKTHETRRIEMTDLASAAITVQRAATQLKTADEDLLFRHPSTGEIINDSKPPRLVWDSAMRACGIRHRPSYNARHTYATAALMAGSQIGWVSRQLGHSSIQMTLKHYAKWIEGEDQGRELAKVNAFLQPRPAGTNLGTNGTS